MAKRRLKMGWGGPRPGAGRKPFLQDPIKRWIFMEREEAEEAEQFAERSGISFAELIRRALRTYIRRDRRER